MKDNSKPYNYLQKFIQATSSISSIIKYSSAVVKYIRKVGSNNFNKTDSLASAKQLCKSLNECTNNFFKNYLYQNNSVNLSEKEAIVFACINDQGSITSHNDVSRKDITNGAFNAINEKDEYLEGAMSEKNGWISDLSNIRRKQSHNYNLEMEEHMLHEKVSLNLCQNFHTKIEINQKLVDSIYSPGRITPSRSPNKRMDHTKDSIENMLDILSQRKESNGDPNWNEDAINQISLSSLDA